ncbi:MAG TPA: Hsp33 family molecular chaperone HslO [Spirochaetota bacterium]|nr:Hsp33 family molecular chaperone HslO [Spirochaetota bacterium]HOL57618.1 Hsp33 family molecular chaperone HslO [Spirochaetota bacterium]HPP03601.1 Hsp33 family molecular chaperone HslO [Spirochaetota bacterium]
MKKDILISAISKDKLVYSYIVILNDTIKEFQKRHNLNIISQAIMARAVTGAVLLSGNLKNEGDILVLNWNCTGPVNKIVVEVNSAGKVRGYIENPNLSFIENSIVDGNIKAEPYIGFGELIVSRFTTSGNPPYHSVVPIVSGEIAEDIALYIQQSLQIESALKIGLSINKDNILEVCGGILLIAYPEVSDKRIKEINNKFEAIKSFTDLLKENDFNYNKIFDNFELEKFAEREISFECNCNISQIKNFLMKLKEEELKEFIEKDGKINVDCKYCGTHYEFLQEEIRKDE